MPSSKFLFPVSTFEAALTSMPLSRADLIWVKFPSLGRPTSLLCNIKLGKGSVKSAARLDTNAKYAVSMIKWAISGSLLISLKMFPRLFSSNLNSHISYPHVLIFLDYIPSGFLHMKQLLFNCLRAFLIFLIIYSRLLSFSWMFSKKVC